MIGAGAARLFCAGMAGQRGLRVLLIDHAARRAEKIRISGGGRCNFTNRDCGPGQFISGEPLLPLGAGALHRGRLHRPGTPPRHRLPRSTVASCSATARPNRSSPCWGQMCRRRVQLATLCRASGAPRGGWLRARYRSGASPARPQLVVATGGLSIPKIGATDLGYRLARQFGHGLVEPRPGLVPLTFDAASWAPFTALAGLSLEVAIGAGQRQTPPTFRRGSAVHAPRASAASRAAGV